MLRLIHAIRRMFVAFSMTDAQWAEKMKNPEVHACGPANELKKKD